MKKQKETRLVLPREEWPYEVPENWVWTRCGFLTDICTGKKDANYGSKNGKYLFFTCAANPIRCDNYSFDCKAIILAGNGDLNNISLYEGKFEAYQRTYVIKPLYEFNLNYLYYIFTFNWIDWNNDKIYGSTIPYIRLGNLKQYPIPLAPLPEQQRIVVRIESLFSKLDAAAEKIRAALDQFPIRKAAILHKAFTGELTKKWQEKHGVGMDSWENRRIDSLCNSLQYGTSQKSKKTGPVIVLRMGNLQDGEIDWSNLAYTDNASDIEKYSLTQGDVLFNRTNSAELVGKTSIYRGEYPAIYAGYLIKLDYRRNELIGDYLNFALNSSKAKEYCQKVKSDGVNQSNINAKKIGAFEIPVPTLPEQKEIIRILDAVFEREQKAKEAAERLLDKIALTKKAILARAFRGKLGTNDPKEASAEGLLKNIMESKR